MCIDFIDLKFLQPLHQTSKRSILVKVIIHYWKVYKAPPQSPHQCYHEQDDNQ